MWMTTYIDAVKEWFRENYPNAFPDIPDGEYIATIDGKLDRIIIENGNINCCNPIRRGPRKDTPAGIRTAYHRKKKNG